MGIGICLLSLLLKITIKEGKNPLVVTFGLDQKMSHTDLLAFLFEVIMILIAEKSTPLISVPGLTKTKGGV